MLEVKIAHLGFIQNIITRMSEKGTSVKTYTVTIMAGALAISGTIPSLSFMVFSIFIISFMLMLNAYFYRQELLFRELYKDVAQNQTVDTNFSLAVSSYEMQIDNTFKVIFTQKSHNLLKFYMTLLIGAIILTLLSSSTVRSHLDHVVACIGS